MNFADLIHELQENTYGAGAEPVEGVFGSSWGSLGLFLPELILCGTIVLLLLFRLFSADRLIRPSYTALFGTLAAFTAAAVQFWTFMRFADAAPEEFFTGLLVYDKLTLALRLFLLLFLVLVIALTDLSGIPDDEDGPDFYTLLLGSTIGMLLMVSANNLLILFLAIEMTSVPSYAMVGFMKGRRKSSEAAFKYVIFGAGAAGVMLYGISLLGGLLGTLELPLLAERLATVFSGEAITLANPALLVLLLAVLMVLVGIAFKLSVVPFHFWCPDAFEGAAAEVAGFLSVASKGAAFGLLLRFVLALGGTSSPELGPVWLYLGLGIGAIAALTATFGNLAAYAQTNVKRLLAYSTIAHAGYMLMAVAALLVLLNPPAGSGPVNPESTVRAIEGLLYYLAVYLFMNLGAFAVVAFIRNEIYSEEIDDYNGLASQCPVLCVAMLVCLFSLVGMPPFGGFIGKFMIFYSLFEAGNVHWFLWFVLVVGGLNTVFSLFYYLRVLQAMFLRERPENARTARVRFTSMPGTYVMLLSVCVLVLGVFIGHFSPAAKSIAGGLLYPPSTDEHGSSSVSAAD